MHGIRADRVSVTIVTGLSLPLDETTSFEGSQKKCSFPLSPYRLESATVSNRLAASLNSKHPWVALPGMQGCAGDMKEVLECMALGFDRVRTGVCSTSHL